MTRISLAHLRAPQPVRTQRLHLGQSHHPLRVFGALLLLLGMLMLLISGFAGRADAHAAHGAVQILQITGTIDSSVAGYLTGAIDDANASPHTAAVVVQLNSPGALKVDVDAIVEKIHKSRVPIVVWVGPPGARAAGGAHAIAQAAHILAVSPGALIGPAFPLDLADGAPFGDALLVVPQERSLDDLPKELSGADVTAAHENDVVGDGAAAFSVATLPDVLRELDGRVVNVDLLGTQTIELDPVTADVKFGNMGLGRRLLHAVASAPLAYLLIIAGALALIFEIFQPGFGVSGITGIALLLLGAYALTVLPISLVGAGLLALGLVLLSVDLALAGLGILTILGSISLTAGSVMLFNGPGLLRISYWLIGSVVASTIAFFVVVMTVVLRAQAGQAQEGADQVVGKKAVVRSLLNPEGHVFVDGALWRARAPEGAGKVKTGTVVTIVGLDDRLTLQVELD